MRLRKAQVVAIILLLSLSPAVLVAGKNAKNKQPQQPPKELVWPAPPEKPRLRFLQEIHGAPDVEPQKKQSMAARLAGLKSADNRRMFAKPFGIAVDSRHRIFVTDLNQGSVFVLDRDQHSSSYLGAGGDVKLQTPMGITVDAKDRIWVADGKAGKIYAFDPQLRMRAALGQKGEIVNPVGLATDLTRNRLYVADSMQHCILVYDTETGLLATKFGKRGTGDGEFNFPLGVAVAPDGRIFVTDAMNRRVQIFNADFKFLDKFGKEGIQLGNFRKPKALALDTFSNVYVVDSDFCNFQIFDQKKRLLMFLGEAGPQPGHFLLPAGIAIDNQNQIYVADELNHRIQIFQLLNGLTDEPAATPAKAQADSAK